MKTYQYLVLGSGVAAGFAVQEFAKHQTAKGKLAIVTADDSVPYDRPPLSKGFLSGQKSRQDILINDESFYPSHGIDVWTDEFVDAVDFEKKRLRTRSGGEFGFG